MAESFTALGSEDLQWSDTDCTTSDDITDDELWTDDDTVVNDNTLWDDDNAPTHSTTTVPVVNTPSLQDTYAPTSNDPLLQSDMLISLNNDITTNEMLGATESTNEIAAGNLSPDSDNTNNKVIPIEAPSIITCDEAFVTIHNESTSVLAMDDYSQSIALLCKDAKEGSPEDVETCFDELADLPSSPEPEAMTDIFNSNPSPALPPNNMTDITSYSKDASIMEDQCLMDQLSDINSTEVDDDCTAEDFAWN